MFLRLIIVCSIFLFTTSCQENPKSDLEDLCLARLLYVFEYGYYNTKENCINLHEDFSYQASDSLTTQYDRIKKFNFNYLDGDMNRQGHLIIYMINNVIVQCKWSAGHTMGSYLGREYFETPLESKLTQKQESITIQENKALYKKLIQNIEWCNDEQLDSCLKEEWFLITGWFGSSAYDDF